MTPLSTRRMDIRREAERFYWYHCIELPGFVTDGDYDLREVLPLYGFPEDMRGMSVLDVGRASGFFSFEFERRGADITATEIGSVVEWDHVGGEARREAWRQRPDAREWSERNLTGAFHLAHEVLASKVRPLTINVYDVSPAIGRFDLVFPGSITSHLRDPITALERLRSVTRGSLVVAAPCFDLPGAENRPLMQLVGEEDKDRRSWWVMNPCGLAGILRAAGFGEVSLGARFALKNRRIDLAVEHIVAHARP